MKKLLVGLFLVLLVLVAVGMFLPTRHAIASSIDIQATPQEIHAFVGDLRKWPEWTPWVEDDPTIETTYGETTSGVGAHQSWTSESGDGELTLTKSDPAAGIAYDMAFTYDTTFLTGERRAPALCTMSYVSSGGPTTVTWTMKGDVRDALPPVVSGYMNLFLKRRITRMFERGLQNLKRRVEASG